MVDVEKITSARELRRATREQKNIWKDAFISYDDPTGYEFSKYWCEGGYATWKDIVQGNSNKEEVAEWLEELEIKLQSRGIQALASAGSVEASKWLASRGWVPTEDKRTKEHKKKAEKAAVEIESDLKRLGIAMIKESKRA